MREHIQIRVTPGTERPIVQRFDATPPHFLFGFSAIFEFSATKFRPGTVILRVTLRQLFDGNALPFAEAAFTQVRVEDYVKSEKVGNGVGGLLGAEKV